MSTRWKEGDRSDETTEVQRRRSIQTKVISQFTRCSSTVYEIMVISSQLPCHVTMFWNQWSFLSQLYGSTTVVMAIYGLHWKWRSLTPCQRQTSEPIEKIFGRINNVIDLNSLAKFGFGKIFRDWGTYTQHIRFCAFFFFFLFIFLTFYALWHRYSLNGWTDFDAQYLKRRRLVRGGAFSMKEKNRFLTLTFKRSKSAILFSLQNFDRHYLENGTR